MKKYTVQELLNLGTNEFDKMTKEQLREATAVLSEEANKRIKDIIEAKIPSNAVSYTMSESGRGLFSSEKSDLNELRSEFTRAKTFLEAKTGSVEGAEEVREKVKEALEEYGINLTNRDYRRFWRVYEELKRRDPSIANKNMKYKVLTEINTILRSKRDYKKTVANVAEEIENRLDEIYEKGEEIENDMGTSNAFEVD